MSELLNSNPGGKITRTMRINLMEQRKAIVAKWQSSGLLDGIEGDMRINVAQLYESEAAHMLNETIESMSEYHLRKYNADMGRGRSQYAQFHLTKLIHYTETDIRKKHCS
jgi:hypothetical protein